MKEDIIAYGSLICFKPYYKWITFNTIGLSHALSLTGNEVLNLIINGLPSILMSKGADE